MCGLIVKETAMISSINTPFWFKSDFIRISPIEPKGIRGVNGASIPAIGIGIIKIQCGKGRRSMLNYALYAPQVALHLISVSRLGDEGCQITFEATFCQVLRKK